MLHLVHLLTAERQWWLDEDITVQCSYLCTICVYRFVWVKSHHNAMENSTYNYSTFHTQFFLAKYVTQLFYMDVRRVIIIIMNIASKISFTKNMTGDHKHFEKFSAGTFNDIMYDVCVGGLGYEHSGSMRIYFLCMRIYMVHTTTACITKPVHNLFDSILSKKKVCSTHCSLICSQSRNFETSWDEYPTIFRFF